MVIKFVYFAALCTCFFGCGHSQITRTEWPYNANQPLSLTTHAPINVNTSSAALLVSSPILYTTPLLEHLKFENTGRTIEATICESGTTAFITYGPAFNNTYRFHKLRFYWNNEGGRACTAIDGHGTPLEVQFLYYKKQYKSFENALKFRDGLVVASFRIQLGPLANPLFNPIGNALTSIRNPGSHVNVLSTWAFAWLDISSTPVRQYFTYPGAYIDFRTGKEYMCTIEVVYVPTVTFISEDQFFAFRNLISADGKPLQNVSPIFAAGCRPLLVGLGVHQGLAIF